MSYGARQARCKRASCVRSLLRCLAVGVTLGAATAARADDAIPVNADVNQATVWATACKPGWTATVRPYVATMKAIKAEMLAAIGEPLEHRNRYELDHIIPLALGGAPIDRRNLRLQPIDEARQKDHVEICLQAAVCDGLIGLDEAREAIWTDWRKAAELCAVNPLK